MEETRETLYLLDEQDRNDAQSEVFSLRWCRSGQGEIPSIWDRTNISLALIILGQLSRGDKRFRMGGFSGKRR